MSTTSLKVSFPGALGTQLVGRLEEPEGPVRAYALFAHCFTCSKDLKAARWLSRTLAGRGIAVLRFDFTGLGESEGDFADTNFSSNREDLVAAADFLRRQYQAPRILIGHSLGGAAVLSMAGDVPEAEAIATIGAPSDTHHLKEGLLAPARDEVEERGEAEIRLAGRPFRVKKQLLDDLEENNVRQRLRKLRVPLLILHSPVDEIVDVDHARRIYQAAQHPKSFVSLDDADHLLTRLEDARYAADVLAAWVSRYLPEETREEEPEEPGLGAGEVLVSSGAEGFFQDIRTSRHHWVADEPLTVPGATDRGPNPYELLLSALGACTSMTLRMYANHKGLPLAEVGVKLRHSRIHAADCEECETKKGKLDQIEKEITLAGELTVEQRGAHAANRRSLPGPSDPQVGDSHHEPARRAGGMSFGRDPYRQLQAARGLPIWPGVSFFERTLSTSRDRIRPRNRQSSGFWPA